tara:strand:+ start:911 stop:3397 length:2487 start_codon:yes stop_codon:yes gene_type:complete
MSNIQAQAALTTQAQGGGRKNSVPQQQGRQQIAQINAVQAPATGSLAPLVMPVPDLETANTLSQAVSAINGFGIMTKSVGDYVYTRAAQNEADIYRSEQRAYTEDQRAWTKEQRAIAEENRAQSAIEKAKRERMIAANSYVENAKAQRDKASLAPTYEGLMNAAAANPNAWLDSQINPALGAFAEDPEALAHLQNGLTSIYAREIAPFVEGRRKESLAKDNQAYQLLQISDTTGSGTTAILLNNSALGVPEQETITKTIASGLTNNAFNGNGAQALKNVMAGLTPEQRKLYAPQFEIAISQGAEMALQTSKKNVSMSIEDAKSKAKDIGDLQARLEASKLSTYEIDDVVINALNPKSSNRYDIAVIAPRFSGRPENDPARQQFVVKANAIVLEEGKKSMDAFVTKVTKGEVPPRDAVDALNKGLLLWDDTKQPYEQNPLAISIDDHTNGVARLASSFKAIEAENARKELFNGTAPMTEENLKGAGISPTDYQAGIQLANKNGVSLIPSQVTAMFAGAVNGDEAAQVALISAYQAGVQFDIPKNSPQNYRYINDQLGAFVRQRKPDGTPLVSLFSGKGLNPQAREMIKNLVASAETSPNTFVEPSEAVMKLAKDRTSISEQGKLEENTEAYAVAAMKQFNSGWFSAGTTDAFGNETSNDASRYLLDEVKSEMMNIIANRGKVQAPHDYSGIAKEAVNLVAKDWVALSYNGTPITMTRANILIDTFGKGVETIPMRIDNDIKLMNIPSTSSVQDISILGNNYGNVMFSVKVVNQDGTYGYRYRETSAPDGVFTKLTEEQRAANFEQSIRDAAIKEKMRSTRTNYYQQQVY